MSAGQLAGVVPTQAGTVAPAAAPQPVPVAATYAPLPAEMGAEQAQAELATRKADPGFMKAWLDGDPAATSVMTRLYGAAFDQAPATTNVRDPAPDRPSGYSLSLPPNGVKVDQQAAAPLLEVAHGLGLGRAAVTVLGERAFAIAGGETPMTDLEAGERLVRWHGEERARAILTAAQAAARRAMERDPSARELLTAIGSDAYVITTLGEAELARGGR